MTRGEMLVVMEELITTTWDERTWSLALLTADAVKSYNEAKEKQRAINSETKIEDLTEAQQSWLRAT